MVEVQKYLLTFNVYLFSILKSIGDNCLMFVKILQNKKFSKYHTHGIIWNFATFNFIYYVF